MASLILCHAKQAKQPYEITRVHIRIYTMEELCYYLCNNLYLIDYTIMNRRLCNWLEDELAQVELAEQLRRLLDQNASVEDFVLAILRGSGIYAPVEIVKIQSLLEQLQNQKEVERAKYKADSLLKGKEYEAAILVYQSIVAEPRDESVKKDFYGKAYACMGAAYGRLFLYVEAAKMYAKAYEIIQEPEILKAYLYSCYNAYPEEQYVKMLSGNAAYLTMDAQLKDEMEKVAREQDLQPKAENLETWKKEYRRIDKN